MRASHLCLIACLAASTQGCGAGGEDLPLVESHGAIARRPARDTLRIATANLWGVVALGLDWADHIDARFDALAARLARNAPELDVVLIQEAWKDSARRRLLEVEGVVRNFPHRVDVVTQRGGAGLVVLSAHPIEEAHFHRFRSQGNLLKVWEGDAIAGKGVLALRLRVGTREVWLGDVHTIACYPGDGAPETACDEQDPNGETRWRQVIELRRFIEGFAGDAPAIVGGDFNFTRSSRYYPLMTADSAPSGGASPPRARGWTEPGEASPAPSRLDYVWTRPGRRYRWRATGPAEPIFAEPVRLASGERVPLSDHPVLAAEFCLVRTDDRENRCLDLDSR